MAGGSIARSGVAGQSHSDREFRNRLRDHALRCISQRARREHSMKGIRIAAAAVLVLACLVTVFAQFLAPAGYEHQFRDQPEAKPSLQHPLGTDQLGRDSLARLLYGLRVSLLLAPLAAALSTLLAGLVGGLAGCFGGWTERVCTLLIDLFLAVPWLFLLITVRAALPLNISPAQSVVITFLLLGML